jgi:hypothetical protein
VFVVRSVLAYPDVPSETTGAGRGAPCTPVGLALQPDEPGRGEQPVSPGSGIFVVSKTPITCKRYHNTFGCSAVAVLTPVVIKLIAIQVFERRVISEGALAPLSPPPQLWDRPTAKVDWHVAPAATVVEA